MSAPEGFETWLHQLNDGFVASTTASLDVEEALMIVKRRAATDLKHDGGTEQSLALVPLEKNRPRPTAARKLPLSLTAALFIGAFVVAGVCGLVRHTASAEKLPQLEITVRPHTHTPGSEDIARLAVSDRGSKTFRYTWLPDKPSQPERSEAITFNGPPQTKYADYPLVSRGSAQLAHDGVTVVITLPNSSRTFTWHGECGDHCQTTRRKPDTG